MWNSAFTVPSRDVASCCELERRERHLLLERARAYRVGTFVISAYERRAARRPLPDLAAAVRRARRRASRRRGRGSSGHGSPEVRDDVCRVPVGREDRVEDLRRPGRAPRRARAGGRACDRRSRTSAGRVLCGRAQLRVGDHRERHVVALGELDLVLERLRRKARDARRRAPRAPAEWSRNAHDCGVQPRAPGNVVPARERRHARAARSAGRRRARRAPRTARPGRPGPATRRARARDRGARQVIGGPVVLGDRQVVRQDVGVHDPMIAITAA